MLRFVNTLSLNFRSAPIVSPATRLGSLFLGHPVDVTDDPDASGFCPVRTSFGGADTAGFVSHSFLREPSSATREALIGQAVREWLRFERGMGKETVTPFFRFVGEMWQAIELNLDGRDNDQPWSAAAISFMVRNSGTEYAGFRFAPAHARYIHDAIKRREANDTAAPFWGFRLHEHRPRLGDMVCKWREKAVDFDTARTRDAFKSHCDIVVQIDSARNELLALGGNVNNSVSITKYRLSPGDFLDDDDNVFAILANRTDD